MDGFMVLSQEWGQYCKSRLVIKVSLVPLSPEPRPKQLSALDTFPNLQYSVTEAENGPR